MSKALASSSAAQLSNYAVEDAWSPLGYSAGLGAAGLDASMTNFKQSQKQGFDTSPRSQMPQAGGQTLRRQSSYEMTRNAPQEFGMSPSASRQGTRQGTALNAMGLTRQGMSRQGLGATLASGLGGTIGSRCDPLLEEAPSTLNAGWAVNSVHAPRPSTRELLRSIRRQGKEEVDALSKHIASLPRLEESSPLRPASRAPRKQLLRQHRSEPDLRKVSDAYKTEAAKAYRAEADRLLQRLMGDVDISHSELPAPHAQRQVCSHVDKAHVWMKHSAAVCQALQESAGSPKLPRNKELPQAGLRLPDGTGPMPGSTKWEKPAEKKKPKPKSNQFDTTLTQFKPHATEAENLSRLASKE